MVKLMFNKKIGHNEKSVQMFYAPAFSDDNHKPTTAVLIGLEWN